MKAGLAAGTIGVVLSLGYGGQAYAGPRDLASHAAIYSMSLSSANLSGGVTGASGKMDYQFADSCDGWVVKNKTDLTFSYNDGAPVVTSWDLLTWESKDGLHYRFRVHSLRDGELSEEIEGRADLDGPGKGGVVKFTQPEERMIRLPRGTLFPTDHTVRLLEAARKGERYVNWPLFDGSGTEGPYDVGVSIGHEVPANSNISPTASNSEVDATLMSGQSWRVLMAFFLKDGNDATPDYESSMRMYQNGVADEVLQSFGNFSLKGTLEKLRMLPKPEC
ncbi:MAG TPA: cell envelope integrity EipB family protein [Candidatus Sulfotelmatobacter sp.]|jgi:hypothetical protein|nr:cell envelope integrity EipB family protein [Candidatus Sulfotelmatobacter sp.]